MKYFMDFNIKIQQTRLGLPWRIVKHQKIVIIQERRYPGKAIVRYCLLTQAEGLAWQHHLSLP